MSEIGESAPILLNSGPSKRSLWRLAEVNRCPQAFAFRYRHPAVLAGTGAVSIPAQALARGSLIHVGVAHFNARKRALQEGTDPNAYFPPLRAMEIVADSAGTAGYLEECKRAVAGYAERYADDPSRIVSVEQSYDITITLPNGEPYIYTQRPDFILEKYGRFYVVDLKTTSKLSPEVVTQYSMTLQMLSYRVLGPALFGDKFGGVIIDVCCWPLLEYRRAILEPVPLMVQRFPQIVQDAEAYIARIDAEKRAFDNWPRVANAENCLHRYGRCQFWDACAWGRTDALSGASGVDIVILRNPVTAAATV